MEKHDYTKPRNTSLELYRILAMFLIVVHHYVVNSGLMEPQGPIYADAMAPASLFLLLMGAWGKIGTNCFVLISGYFLCQSRITARRFAKLLFEVEFYRIVINLIFVLCGYGDISKRELLLRLLPVTSISTGFIPTFLVFYLCIPFLNILTRNMNRKQHVYLLALLSFVYIFLGTFPFLFTVQMNYVSWFAVLYFFAAYVRKYPGAVFEKTALWGWLSLVCVALCSLSVVACAWLGQRAGRQMAYTFVVDSNTFLAFATGFSSFLFFRNLKVPHIPLINGIAASCFGVLLIHANSGTMRQWLWVDVLDVVSVYGKPGMAAHMLLSCLGIFLICTGLDRLRILLVERPVMAAWDRAWPRIAEKWLKLEQKLFPENN